MSTLKYWLQQPLFHVTEAGFSRKAIAGGLFLLLLGLKVTHGLSHYMDLLLWDEANYMKAGSHFLKHINKEWGPAYASWYQVGFVFIRDFLRLYIFNQAVLAVLVPVLFYLVLLRARVNTVMAIFLSAGWLFASFNLPMWPKVSHFCILVILAGILIAACYKEAFMQWLWVSFGFMLAAFARPEIYMSFPVILAIAIAAYVLTKPSLSRRTKGAIFFIAIITLFFHFKIGVPILNGSRSGMAFGQHFAYNIILQKNLPYDFWIVWPDIYKEYFGQATGFFGALSANKKAVMEHLLQNFNRYTDILLHRPAEAVFPSLVWGMPPGMQQLLLIALLIYGYIFVRRRVASPIPPEARKLAVIFFLLALPSFLASFIVFPREHYFLLQLPFLLWMVAMPFVQVTNILFRPVAGNFLMPVLVIVLAIFSPTAKKFEYFHLWHFTEGTPNSDAYRLIQPLKGTKRLVIMENEGGLAKLVKGAQWVRGFEKTIDQGFYDFMADKDPDIIYVTPALSRDLRYSLDGQWMVFSQSPYSFGYTKVALPPSTNYYLLVRDKPPYDTIVDMAATLHAPK